MIDLSTLVTDRTQADVDAGNAKGSYRAEDLNRVAAAVNQITLELRKAGCDPVIRPIEGWADEGWADPAFAEAYLANIIELRAQIGLMLTTPQPPERIGESRIGLRDGLDYRGANAIEQILQDIDTQLQKMKTAWVACGPTSCGGDYL